LIYPCAAAIIRATSLAQKSAEISRNFSLVRKSRHSSVRIVIRPTQQNFSPTPGGAPENLHAIHSPGARFKNALIVEKAILVSLE